MKYRFGRDMRSVFLAVLFGMAVTGTAMAEETDETTFVQGTTINGLGISGMTVEEAESHIEMFYSTEYQLTIREREGDTELIDGESIGFQMGFPDGVLETILQEQNASGRRFGPDADNDHQVDMQSSYDERALTEQIHSLTCLTGSDARPTSDAHISEYQEGKPFVIVPEVRGTMVYRDRVVALIQAAVAAGDTELDLEAEGCYVEPKVTSEDEQLKELCTRMNQYDPVYITYEFGTDDGQNEAETAKTTQVLDWSVIVTWISGVQDGQIQLDREQVTAYVKSLADTWDTAYKKRTFQTATGREVTLTGSYGWRINQKAETDALISLIQSGQSQERTPIYATVGVSRTAPEWGNTYAEVDLTGQHVYMVKGGEVIWDAPCVTGNVSKGWGTPAGIYSLTYKERDRVLRGDKREDGTYEYESPVSFWMPFNGGIGFHDANWRGSFGGTIFQTNGSHGCINLPPNKAQGLYDEVYTGMPVFCYE